VKSVKKILKEKKEKKDQFGENKEKLVRTL